MAKRAALPNPALHHHLPSFLQLALGRGGDVRVHSPGIRRGDGEAGLRQVGRDRVHRRTGLGRLALRPWQVGVPLAEITCSSHQPAHLLVLPCSIDKLRAKLPTLRAELQVRVDAAGQDMMR